MKSWESTLLAIGFSAVIIILSFLFPYFQRESKPDCFEAYEKAKLIELELIKKQGGTSYYIDPVGDTIYTIIKFGKHE